MELLQTAVIMSRARVYSPNVPDEQVDSSVTIQETWLF